MIAKAEVSDRWPAIRDLLADNATYLLHQGSFAAKKTLGGRRWELRFRVYENGQTRHRSIAVGAIKLKAKAESWLKELREILVWQKEIEACCQLVGWISLQLASRSLRHGWGPRRKRRL